ncbi:MAG TPA: hypothetical protein VH641_21170 [Streptosporangiaceae bacterium]|jgi:hypothetical protein
MATTADGSHDGAAAARARRLRAWLTPVNVIIVAATLLAVGLRVYYQHTQPGFLLGVNEYDDGPYFGSAVRLVHGALPYRDFVLVQPPGIALLMSPAAGLSYLVGTAWGMVIGRIMTVLAGAAAVVLAGLLVRHRGPVAVVVTCGILAVYPDSVITAHTVLVEPWLVLFCLVGAVAVFDRDRLAGGGRRLLWGGVAFGFAGAVEAWAIVPVLVVLLLCLPVIQRAWRFAAGVAAGFLVPSLPFIAIAPTGFYHSLITAQIGSRAHTFRVGNWYRLENMVGLPPNVNWSHGVIALASLAVIAVVIGGQLYAWRAGTRPARPLDWFAMLTAVLAVGMFLWPPQFHYHFTTFLAPFLALSVGLTLANVAAVYTERGRDAHPRRWVVPAVTGLAAVVIAVLASFQPNSSSTLGPVIGTVPAAVDRVIPPGSCVLTDQVSVTIAANRFVSSAPRCPLMVDTLGTDLALSRGLKPETGAGRVPAVRDAWLAALRHSQYLLLTNSNWRRIPWSAELTRYMHRNFVQVAQPSRRLTIYARTGLHAR